MKRKLQVFISSTYLDLIEERQAAVSAILKAGHIPAGMELFTAGDRSQLDTINSWIDESDVYMLILGGRYGAVEPTSNVSYTELEFDYAASQNKPMFAVVIKDDALEDKVRAHGTNFSEKENPKELKLFRTKVLSRISSFFEDVKDIKLCVHETLADYSTNRELSGWVSGSEIVDSKPLMDEINKLSSENTELKEKVSQLEHRLATIPAPNKEDSAKFDELKDTLSKTNISLPKDIDDGGKDVEITLLKAFDVAKDALITGVTNRGGMSDYHRFVFFNISPKLQIHGLVDNEKVAGVQYRRCYVTPLGLRFLAYLEKSKLESL
ncbi:DUF4062 domain-containing protein [Pseudomonas chlororaphis]|uniref:DUF4062 domain-containing protein n=1 Tax=Pseudomonas TaxID=286 RepID=UPI000C88B7E5|nr:MULTISPECIES: DUF4062 domain-containing protein [Pseudomonas]MBP5085992.1 DUF4062 domain-containing protein [Pseudomonas chlororaphis]PMY37830.1 hypothetical protein C1Y36_28195 [Pseudomonas sp. FW306-2-2C-D06C]PYC39174.1 DUF4062 domain-containing protein [Pseudomonas chlororaphis]QTT83600.1 DUF4062 domain-containing protein [Pseudomonas chlororaphis]